MLQPTKLTVEDLAAGIQVGHTLFTRGMTEQAKNIFQGIVLIDRKNAYAHSILGSIHKQAEEYESALRHFSTAIKAFPGDVGSLTQRAEVYLLLGRWKEAAADLKTVISLDPESTNPHTKRAQLLAGAARRALTIATKEGPEGLNKAIQNARKAG